MEEDFLKFLDDKHDRYIQSHHIKNKWFIDYTVLETSDLELDEQFYVAKGQKSRILIKHKNIWVDLTDYDLIFIFCDMEEETLQILLSELKGGYNGNWSDFNFRIASKEFLGKGVDYSKYKLDENIFLEADFEVKLKDILFVFNMVLYKDMNGQKYVEKNMQCKLIERTIMKYISLILYYKFDHVLAFEYLNNIKYPICQKNEMLVNKIKMKKYDRCFIKNGFEKLLSLC